MTLRLPVRPDRHHAFDPRPDVPFFLVTTPGWEQFVQAAITGGQWHHPDGLFYGGQAQGAIEGLLRS